MPNDRLLVSPAGSRHHHMHQICQVFAICKLFAASVSPPWALQILNPGRPCWGRLTQKVSGTLILSMPVITDAAMNLWFHCSSSVVNVAIEAVFFAFDIACTSQLEVMFSFPNSTHACPRGISAFLLPHPVLASIPCTCPCYTGAQWSVPPVFYLVH